MYISNVRNVIFSFQDFFLKRGEKTIFFQEKQTLKNRNMKPFSSPFHPLYPYHPGAKLKVDYLVKNQLSVQNAVFFSML